MKNKLMAGLSFVMVLVLMVGVIASVNPSTVSMADVTGTDPKLVTVSGEGKIVVTPDLAYIDIGVQTKNKDAAIAQQENAKLMEAVIAAIKAKGIKTEDIKTTGYSLYQTYDYYADKQGDPYYLANNTVNVKVNDIKLVGSLIDTATKAGANSINSIRFTIKDDSQYYQEALKLAMNNAKGKATAIMTTFSKVPGVPYSVSESSYGGGIIYDYGVTKAMGDQAMEASTPIEVGELTITANVSVSYDY